MRVYFLPDEKGSRQRLLHGIMEGRTGYLLTTTGRINGAAAYPGVKDILAEKMRGDYYVVFPSLHEGNDSSGSLRSMQRKSGTSATHQCHLWRRGDVVGQSILLSQEPETAAVAVKLTCDRK